MTKTAAANMGGRCTTCSDLSETPFKNSKIFQKPTFKVGFCVLGGEAVGAMWQLRSCLHENGTLVYTKFYCPKAP